MVDPPRVIVMVEGRSDLAALEVLLGTHGLTNTPALQLHSMDGVTNVRRDLLAARTAHPEATVVGLYDHGERRFVRRALEHAGATPITLADSESALAAHGFFECHDDLEDELLRALPGDRIFAAIDAIGERGRFGTFTHQPEWRERSFREQVHRFAGSGSGRKEALARSLAVQIDRPQTPPPLAKLVQAIHSTLG